MASPRRRHTLEGVTTTVSSTGPDVRYVALGALGAVGWRVARLARGAVVVTDAVARPCGRRRVRSAAGVGAGHGGPAGRRAGGGRPVDRVRAGIDAGARVADAVTDRVATDPLVIRAIGEIVDGVQGQLLDSILPDVLDRLAADPDQVRAIVRGQSRGMIDEATHEARSRAVAGDEIVDRLAARILRRQPSRRHSRAARPR